MSKKRRQKKARKDRSARKLSNWKGQPRHRKGRVRVRCDGCNYVGINPKGTCKRRVGARRCGSETATYALAP